MNNKVLDEILVPLIPYLACDMFVGSGGGSASASDTKESNEGKEVKKEENLIRQYFNE